MIKKYSPVQVSNPTSLQHLVKVQPGQEICISFDLETYKDISVQVSSEYLKKGGSYEKDGKYVCNVFQDSMIADWHEYSSCFLGEIWIDSRDSISKVVILLESDKVSKADHLTIINPDCYDIRAAPHQIIELVVFDVRFGHQDEWNCVWRPKSNIEVEQIGYDYLSLHSWYQYFDAEDSPDYRYARYPRVEINQQDTNVRQHHFWFRFDKSVLEMSGGAVEHVGDFLLSGCSDKFLKGKSEESNYFTSVYLDLRKVKKGRVLHTLGLEKKEDYSQYNYRHIQSEFPRTNSIVHVPRKHDNRKFKKYKEDLPQTREVVINCIQTNSFEEGCKVLSAMPVESTGVDYDCNDCDVYDDCPDDCYGYSRGYHGIIPYHHRHRGPQD